MQRFGQNKILPLLSPSRKIFKVSELTAALRSAVEEVFHDLWVEGEVANLKIPQSGHCYFTLKDEATQIKAVLFRSHSRFLPFIPREGASVLLRGHLTLYASRSEYQIIVDFIEPRGVGALMAALEALKERLRKEGLFDAERKKPIPVFPAKLALITSPTGAVLKDFLKILLEREIPLEILIVPVPVQGENAAREIARAIFDLNRFRKQWKIDLVVLARGGGSLEDLWAFNEEIVARAIFQSKIPVLTAIGHETDTTVADFVADLRAATPSVAAEMIARSKEKQIEQFSMAKEMFLKTMQARIEQHGEHLCHIRRLVTAPQKIIQHLKVLLFQYALRHRAALCRTLEGYDHQHLLIQKRLDAHRPRATILRWKEKAALLSESLFAKGEEFLRSRRETMTNTFSQLNLLSPLQVLQRGYSITEKFPSQKIVRDAAEVTRGERLQIRLHRGLLFCSVKRIKRAKERNDGRFLKV